MSITLGLPAELETELAAQAAELGLSLTEHIERLLLFNHTAAKGNMTGKELIEYWEAEGLIGIRTAISDSQAYARELRDRAERRDLPVT